MPWHNELSTARTAALHAARLTKRVLSSSVTQVSKADASPVTVADFAAQALLIRILREAFPEDGFVGEEDAGVLRRDEGLRGQVFGLYREAVEEWEAEKRQPKKEGEKYVEKKPDVSVDEMLDLIDLGGRGEGGRHGRFWAMDPVDGTASFLRGEQYAVSVALLQHGVEVLTAVVYPNLRLVAPAGRIAEDAVDATGLGIMLSAVQGQGVTKTVLSDWHGHNDNNETLLSPLQASPSREQTHLIDCHRNPAPQRSIVRRVCEALSVPFPGTDVWASHVRYAGLILGGGDLLIRLPRGETARSCIWDHAGAQLMFRELGGRVTDLDGKEVDFGMGRYLSGNRGLVLARDGELHGEVVRVIKEVMRDGM
ncbi:hypothetical protein E4U43_008143 [Claviceps pusilla]|uniref:3'(2'),5'-bisphosphate nucleotidase n=1 Tax=Claviceps pusilla TaxID=123648 RepID=A0A9P7NBV0_9HYPO|nr:hypothetical protein E4U43_008143 [Claviceps pusilla]